jgi:hypothetical protein
MTLTTGKYMSTARSQSTANARCLAVTRQIATMPRCWSSLRS